MRGINNPSEKLTDYLRWSSVLFFELLRDNNASRNIDHHDTACVAIISGVILINPTIVPVSVGTIEQES